MLHCQHSPYIFNGDSAGPAPDPQLSHDPIVQIGYSLRGHSRSRNEEMRNEKWEMRKWGNEEMGKWGNGKKVHCIPLSKQLTFCFCSHQGKVNVHACTHWESSLPDSTSWDQRGMQRHHISPQANSMYKFFTFDSLLAISWSLLNLWIVHSTVYNLWRLLHAVACIVMDIQTVDEE